MKWLARSVWLAPLIAFWAACGDGGSSTGAGGTAATSSSGGPSSASASIASVSSSVTTTTSGGGATSSSVASSTGSTTSSANGGGGASSVATTASAGGAGGTGAIASSSGVGGAGGMMVCVPGSTSSCYSGPLATRGVGICKDGQMTCLPDGSGYGACLGDVLPSPEDCSTLADENCDGTVNEASAGCVCTPSAVAACYSGPANTLGVGLCVGGTMTCKADGKSFGPCLGEVTPVAETCLTPGDDDCNGQTNEGGAGCACVPGSMQACYSGPPATQGVGVCKGGLQTCNAAGTGYGACAGEVLPSVETCNTPVDDNCDGQVNEGGAGCVCSPNATTACYTGPQGTLNVGVCKAGTQTCNAQGTANGPCVGEVLPSAETCDTPVDDNCDGQINEGGAGCVCTPNAVTACYTGPQGTLNVGVCKAGAQTCNAQGTALGPCAGEVVPGQEVCGNGSDEDCDGNLDNGCAVTWSGQAAPIFVKHCAACHTILGSGGANFATVYADSQLPSYYCAGKTKGACALVRIQEGSMPQSAGCTGNPALDTGNAACLTAAEQATLQAWITGGQLP